MTNRVGWILTLIVACAAMPAQAQMAIKLDKKEPVYLEAEEVGYDQPTSTVEAIGRVQIIQGEHVIFADRLSYNQNTDIVMASGHVSELEPDGNVYFAEDLQVERDMSEGIVQTFRVRLKDNSLFAAREAQKISPKVTVLRHAVYTPCTVCARPDGTDSPPLWQIRARKARLDENEQKIYYRDAFFDVYGVPMLYTPYYSQPMPGSPSKSGFLTLEYGHDTNLGIIVKAPIYISIASNMDSIITPIYTKEGAVLAGEFRHLTESGAYEISGSITDSQAYDNSGNLLPGNEVRGHLQGKGDFKIDDIYSWGFDFRRSTDTTYLRLYHFGYEDQLTSQAYIDRIEGRDYATVQALSFQGLQPGDHPETEPPLIPVLDVHTESRPLWAGSRLFATANAYSFNRQLGDNSSRLTALAGWRLPYVTSGGQIYELTASMRGDQYSVDDAAFGGTTFSFWSYSGWWAFAHSSASFFPTRLSYTSFRPHLTRQ